MTLNESAFRAPEGMGFDGLPTIEPAKKPEKKRSSDLDSRSIMLLEAGKLYNRVTQSSMANVFNPLREGCST